MKPGLEEPRSAKPPQSDDVLVTQVEDIRRQSNRLWMDILRTALWYSPGETKRILRLINDNDAKVGDLLRKVAQ